MDIIRNCSINNGDISFVIAVFIKFFKKCVFELILGFLISVFKERSVFHYPAKSGTTKTARAKGQLPRPC
jgi:hypothetical protein